MMWMPLLLSATVQTAPLTPNRFDMGERLIRLEQAWQSKDATSDRKQRTIPHLTQAVMAFFGGRFDQACESLDRGRAQLLNQSLNPLDAVIVRFAPGQIDRAEETLNFQVGMAYGARDLSPQVTASADATGTVNLSILLGDQKLQREFVRIRDFQSRVKQLEASSSREAKELAQLLQEADRGQLEAQLPLERILRQAEELANRKLKPEKVNEVFFALEGGVRIRAMVPERPQAIVVALHGAGGSENMFFEAYGAGEAVREAARRNWAFVSPRSGPDSVTASLRWLQQRYGIKDLPLFVMGHSMGGGLAANSAGSQPAAVALFAPATGRLPDALLERPVFHAVGAKEIGALLMQNRRIAEQLRGESKHVTREYPDAEHLMIVAEALRDAYGFFDRVLSGAR